MRIVKLGISHCRNCGFYTPEGRRGGHCSQLNVHVQSEWKTCSLAISPFISPLQRVEGISLWRGDMLKLPEGDLETIDDNCAPTLR